MQQSFELKLIDKTSGKLLNADLECWANQDFNIKLIWDREPLLYSGTDLYECLQLCRKRLEGDGIFILCNGSRIDTYPSRQLRDTSNGVRTYLLEAGKTPSIILNLLDFTECNIGTIQEQNNYYKKWKDDLKILLNQQQEG
ncbi:hypothetical protein [Chitinophaga defluvii]|uniref:Uncharacterized protein n=1 Tax=Chitinophaga defluvii TaxID=3163343 RepID=A0ABV2T216_9BACT